MNDLGVKYQNVVVEIDGILGIIKLNRPASLNALSEQLIVDVIGALRDLDEHKDTIFTVLTGEGKFFSSGADIKELSQNTFNKTLKHEIRVDALKRFAASFELMRSMVDHRKVLVLAMNGPGVGAGGAWFQGYCDLFYASSSTYLDIPFSELGVVPEGGSAPALAESLGVHRSNDYLIFRRKINVDELHASGLVNHIFPQVNFLDHVKRYLKDEAERCDHNSLISVKKLQNASRRDARMMAITNSVFAMVDQFSSGRTIERFVNKRKSLQNKRNAKL